MAQILRLEASVYRWRDDAFNSFSLSIASHMIPADKTAPDYNLMNSEKTGAERNNGNDTSICGFGGNGIDTVRVISSAPKTSLGDGSDGTDCSVCFGANVKLGPNGTILVDVEIGGRTFECKGLRCAFDSSSHACHESGKARCSIKSTRDESKTASSGRIGLMFAIE